MSDAEALLEARLQEVWDVVQEHPFECECDACRELSAVTDEWLALEN